MAARLSAALIPLTLSGWVSHHFLYISLVCGSLALPLKSTILPSYPLASKLSRRKAWVLVDSVKMSALRWAPDLD